LKQLFNQIFLNNICRNFLFSVTVAILVGRRGSSDIILKEHYYRIISLTIGPNSFGHLGKRSKLVFTLLF